MKKHTFAGLTAMLVVGVFYTFMFCMIGNIDEEVPDLDPYTVNYMQTSPTVSYDSSFLIEQTTEASTEKEAHINTELKADGTEKITEVTMPETAVEIQSPDREDVKDTIVETTKATTKAETTAQTTAKTTAATTTEATTVETTVTTAATTTEATTVETTVATTTEVTTVTTQATTTVPETTVTTTVATTKPEPKPTGKLPQPKDINNGETLSYRYNGVSYTENAYDALCKIVNAEMGSSFNKEALKAQTVAAYSFIKYHNNMGSTPSVAIKTPVSQTVKQAVKEVYGIGIYYGGKIAQTTYSASTGGSSTSARDVWGTNVPYLVAVPCEYDVVSDPHYGSKKTFTKDEIYNAVLKETGISLSGDPSQWFTFLPESEGGVADGGYVGKMLIGGKSGYVSKSSGRNIKITGRAVRENILNYRIKSAKFTIDYSDGMFTFTTYGYGHGVGMSQNGANAYAKYAGYNYYDILNHYYTGVEIR